MSMQGMQAMVVIKDRPEVLVLKTNAARKVIQLKTKRSKRPTQSLREAKQGPGQKKQT